MVYRVEDSTQEQGDWTVENAVGDEKFRQPILVQFPPGVADTMVVLERHVSVPVAALRLDTAQKGADGACSLALFKWATWSGPSWRRSAATRSLLAKLSA